MTTAPILPVIAIDGPAASGKTTLARRLAAHFGFDHLNTGRLYRAVGYKVFSSGHTHANVEKAVEIAENLTQDDINFEGLDAPEVGQQASMVAGLMPVRAALLDFQRNFCRKPPSGKGAVLCGRDITTYIWPDAPARLFVTASPEARAHRRYMEIQNKLLSGADSVNTSTVLADLTARDERDAANSPYNLKIAPGVFVLDTTDLNVAESFDTALQYVAPRLGQ